MFARWGRFVYRFRWATLIASALLLGLSIVAVLTGANLTNSGNFGSDLAAGQASKLHQYENNPPRAPGRPQLTLLFNRRPLAAHHPPLPRPNTSASLCPPRAPCE